MWWPKKKCRWNIRHKSSFSSVCSARARSPIRRYASVLQGGSRGNISFVCGPIADPKTLWNWLPIQFSGGRKRKHCITPVLSYESFNLPSYSLSPSIFITRSFSRFRSSSCDILPGALLYYPLVAEQAMPHSVNNSLCSASVFLF